MYFNFIDIHSYFEYNKNIKMRIYAIKIVRKEPHR